jgi:hypothetical protein
MIATKNSTLPLFPDYTVEEVEKNIFTFTSHIHIHKEEQECVKIYLYPIETTYVAKTTAEKKLVISSHLRKCFRMSKYVNTDIFDVSSLTLLIELDKKEEDFLHKIHYQYM